MQCKRTKMPPETQDNLLSLCCLQCSDAVGWAAGRASSRKKYGGWWRWALVSPDGVVPSLMGSVSASVNLPLHHKVQKFSSGTGSPGWSRKKGHKTVVVCGVACGHDSRGQLPAYQLPSDNRQAMTSHLHSIPRCKYRN